MWWTTHASSTSTMPRKQSGKMRSQIRKKCASDVGPCICAGICNKKFCSGDSMDQISSLPKEHIFVKQNRFLWKALAAASPGSTPTCLCICGHDSYQNVRSKPPGKTTSAGCCPLIVKRLNAGVSCWRASTNTSLLDRSPRTILQRYGKEIVATTEGQ